MSIAAKRIVIGLILIIGTVILFSTLAQAQPQRMSVEDRVKMLRDSLKLTDVQATKITKILEDQREEMTTVMSTNGDDRDAMRAAMQEVRKKMDERIKAVLTEKQAKKYDEMPRGPRARN